MHVFSNFNLTNIFNGTSLDPRVVQGWPLRVMDRTWLYPKCSHTHLLGPLWWDKLRRESRGTRDYICTLIPVLPILASNSPKEDGLLGWEGKQAAQLRGSRNNINKKDVWNFPVAQWLRPCAPEAAAGAPSLVGQLGPTCHSWEFTGNN